MNFTGYSKEGVVMDSIETIYNEIKTEITRTGKVIRTGKSRIKDLVDETLADDLFDTIIEEVELLEKNYHKLNNLISQKIFLEDLIDNHSELNQSDIESINKMMKD